MSLTNRQRGDYFERQTRDALLADGWFVSRSAGSLGVADLVALRDESESMLVSCKINGRIGPKERAELLESAETAGAVPVVASRPRRGHVVLGKVVAGSARPVAEVELKVPTRSRDKDEAGDDDA